MDMQTYIKQNDYKNVLHYFNQLSQVPRGSYQNQKISDYLVEFAKENKLRFIQDEALNVILFKPASKGYEDHPAVILQGHMDMVCVKKEGSMHDFTKDGLKLSVDQDEIHANGTTLGGDDGIAIAYAMALLTDETLQHPPLEIIITTDEEVGMEGANALDVSELTGHRMLNIDSEDEDICWCSCAGGLRIDAEIEAERVNLSGTRISLSISGLFGGHSGVDIHKKKPNATLLMARILFELKENYDFMLMELSGGEKDNSIPVSSKASIIVHSDEADEICNQIDNLLKKHHKLLCNSEPNLNLQYSCGNQDEYSCVTPVAFEKILFLLLQAPNGVQAMSAVIDGLVETSLNLGVFELTDKAAIFHYSLRSSVADDLTFLGKKIEYIVDFLGGNCEFGSRYPAWEYKNDSMMRSLYCAIYRELNAKELVVAAVHAGLECGLLSEKIPDLDIISIGPNMKDIHTHKERLNAVSAIRVYRLIETMLSRL